MTKKPQERMKRGSEAIIDLTEESDSGNESEAKKKKVKIIDKLEKEVKEALNGAKVDLTGDEQEEKAGEKCKHCDHR